MAKRYIEADRAIDALKAIRYGLWEIDIPSSTVPEYVEHHEQIKNMMEITDGWIKKLEEQSTADVVERKRGKWIIKDNPGTGWYRVTCSECGEDVTSTIPVIGFFPNAKPIWNFCPDCGADMREETDNEA